MADTPTGAPAPQLPTITVDQARKLTALVAEVFPNDRHHDYAWNCLNKHFKVTGPSELPAARFDEACRYIREITGAPAILNKVTELQNAVEWIDCLAQGALSKIRTIAILAVNSMERPDSYRHPEEIASVLNTIWFLAENTADCLCHEAESIGCGYVDDAMHRRHIAHAAARKEGAS